MDNSSCQFNIKSKTSYNFFYVHCKTLSSLPIIETDTQFRHDV